MEAELTLPDLIVMVAVTVDPTSAVGVELRLQAASGRAKTCKTESVKIT